MYPLYKGMCVSFGSVTDKVSFGIKTQCPRTAISVECLNERLFVNPFWNAFEIAHIRNVVVFCCKSRQPLIYGFPADIVVPFFRSAHYPDSFLLTEKKEGENCFSPSSQKESERQVVAVVDGRKVIGAVVVLHRSLRGSLSGLRSSSLRSLGGAVVVIGLLGTQRFEVECLSA